MKASLRHEELQQKGLKLFRLFHFGEDMSKLESLIENIYLRNKQNKYVDYLRTGVTTLNHPLKKIEKQVPDYLD